MRISKHLRKFAVGCFASLLLMGWPVAVLADTAITVVPSAWLIQRYVGGGIVIFHTGSPCSQGQLYYVGSSSEEAAELWSLITSAKIAGRTVLVWYDETIPTCAITSFGLAPN